MWFFIQYMVVSDLSGAGLSMMMTIKKVEFNKQFVQTKDINLIVISNISATTCQDLYLPTGASSILLNTGAKPSRSNTWNCPRKFAIFLKSLFQSCVLHCDSICIALYESITWNSSSIPACDSILYAFYVFLTLLQVTHATTTSVTTTPPPQCSY